jgi:hypothetical protein
MTTTAHESARQTRVNGGPGNVIHLPGQRRLEGWEFMKAWAAQRGWGTWRLAGAMILTATPEEKKRLPSQHVLTGYWGRWLSGKASPDAHRADPNATGLYRPIIARMMGTTPEQIWPSQRWGNSVSMNASGDLVFKRLKLAGKLVEMRAQLADLQERLRHMQELKDAISAAEAEVTYLDALLAVPLPGTAAQGRQTL